MILAQDNEGNYIKTANTSHKIFLSECLSDWRPRVITEEEIDSALLYSENFNSDIFQNIVFDYPSIIIIYCQANHTETGIYKCGFRCDNGMMALDIEYVAMHPSCRGQGLHSKFEKIVSWFMNQRLKIDIAYYEVFKDVPQLMNLTPKYNQEIHYTTGGLPGKIGAVFVYDKFKEGYEQHVGNTFSFTSSIPEISYESRARATDKHKLKKFNLVWNIDGGMKIIRRD